MKPKKRKIRFLLFFVNEIRINISNNLPKISEIAVKAHTKLT
jgi:hypothetical protein